MYDLLSALKTIISRKVANIQTLRTDAARGDTVLSLQNAKRFEPCQEIVIYREGEEEGEIHEIERTIDYKTIELKESVSEDYSTSNTKVQALLNGKQWIRGIYIGDPPVIPQYPAITIFGSGKSTEWLTIHSTSEKYLVEISVYAQAADYSQSVENVYKITKSIERTLFYNIYPLVQPFFSTTLLEDVEETDTVIRVEDNSIMRNFVWFFVENDKYTRYAKPKTYYSNGVIDLAVPLMAPFSAGDDVIFPGRHMYDTRPESTSYGNFVKNSLLWGSRISYYAIEEVLRPDKMMYPLNR